MMTNALRAAAVKTKFLENYEFVFLKEDIHRFISSTELFMSNIRGLRYTGLKKVHFFVGHPVQAGQEHAWNFCCEN